MLRSRAAIRNHIMTPKYRVKLIIKLQEQSEGVYHEAMFAADMGLYGVAVMLQERAATLSWRMRWHLSRLINSKRQFGLHYKE